MLAVNEAGVLLASLARKVTTTSPEMENRNCKGVIVTLDATTVTAQASITLSIEFKDLASGKWEKILTATAVTAQGTHSYLVYPDAGLTPGDDIAQITPWPLPRYWRVTVTAADDKSVTYSVGYNYLV
jgi:hypothetical protein